MTYPENYRYTKEHEWVLLEGENATIGITFHAQEELGDIVFVELPTLGVLVQKGKTFGSVESVKAVSDIYAPVTGEVIEINEALATAPEKLNEDPHTTGWLIKVRVTDPGEAANLLSAVEYQTYVGAEQ
jgi:glycine cleavage system H protein